MFNLGKQKQLQVYLEKTAGIKLSPTGKPPFQHHWKADEDSVVPAVVGRGPTSQGHSSVSLINSTLITTTNPPRLRRPNHIQNCAHKHFLFLNFNRKRTRLGSYFWRNASWYKTGIKGSRGSFTLKMNLSFHLSFLCAQSLKGQRHRCAAGQGSTLGFNSVTTVLKFLIIFKQRLLHIHFAWGRTMSCSEYLVPQWCCDYETVIDPKLN